MEAMGRIIFYNKNFNGEWTTNRPVLLGRGNEFKLRMAKGRKSKPVAEISDGNARSIFGVGNDKKQEQQNGNGCWGGGGAVVMESICLCQPNVNSNGNKNGVGRALARLGPN